MKKYMALLFALVMLFSTMITVSYAYPDVSDSRYKLQNNSPRGCSITLNNGVSYYREKHLFWKGDSGFSIKFNYTNLPQVPMTMKTYKKQISPERAWSSHTTRNTTSSNTTTQSYSSNSNNYYCLFELRRTQTNGQLGLGFTITP